MPEIHKNFFEKHKGQFIVGYFGGHALSNALDILLDVAKKMNDSQISFVLVGDGAEKKRLLKRKEEENLDQVHFLPSISKQAVPKLVEKFDCIYMGGADSPLYRFGLCLNKMFDSMMAGKPIICAFTTPQTIIEEYNCGFMCKSNDIEGVIDAIRQIEKMNQEKRKKIGENGKKAIFSHFTYEKLAADFAALF